MFVKLRNIENVCKSCPCKAGKLHGLIKRRILMNAFFKFQFNYCPVIWMFRSCLLNNKIHKLHKGSLIIIKKSDFFGAPY